MQALRVWTEIITLFLIVLGAFNWGLVGLFKFNAVSWLAKRTHKSIEPIVYVVIGVSALLHIISRDYYLRFLGQAAFPCGSLVERVPEGADTKITIFTDPNVNVMYWASEPGKEVQQNPWIAYKEYANAGVARSDANGRATLHVRKPAAYRVPWKGVLPAHVHYRTCQSSGMMSRVETVAIPTA